MPEFKKWQIKAVIIFVAGSFLGLFVNHDLLRTVCFNDDPEASTPAVCSQEIVLDPTNKFQVPKYEEK